MERSREKQIVDFSTGSPWETVTLTALGRNRQLYTHILDEGQYHGDYTAHFVAGVLPSLSKSTSLIHTHTLHPSQEDGPAEDGGEDNNVHCDGLRVEAVWISSQEETHRLCHSGPRNS